MRLDIGRHGYAVNRGKVKVGAGFCSLRGVCFHMAYPMDSESASCTLAHKTGHGGWEGCPQYYGVELKEVCERLRRSRIR